MEQKQTKELKLTGFGHWIGTEKVQERPKQKAKGKNLLLKFVEPPRVGRVTLPTKQMSNEIRLMLIAQLCTYRTFLPGLYEREKKKQWKITLSMTKRKQEKNRDGSVGKRSGKALACMHAREKAVISETMRNKEKQSPCMIHAEIIESAQTIVKQFKLCTIQINLKDVWITYG